MLNSRNEVYPDPFDEFDPHHRISGKRAFNENVRCLQSKINLKMFQEENRKARAKESISVKQSFLEEFDRKYRENCDNNFMSRKMRGVSNENPFQEHNKPPIEHLIPDYILEKPCKISPAALRIDDKPLAGKYSEIGRRVLSEKNPKIIMTGPWDQMMILDSEEQRLREDKAWPTNPTLKKYEPADLDSHLHRIYVPPAYMTQAGATYTGS